MQAEALWKYVLFTGLQLRRVQNESPALLSLFPGFPRDTYERIGQIFFERFNVAAFSVLDRPMAQLYAASALSGIVVDIGDTLTDITPIYDGLPISGAHTTARVGVRSCENFLAHLFRSNTSVTAALAELAIPPAEQSAALRALARQVWQAGLVRVPVAGIAVCEPEDEGVTDIAAVLVAQGEGRHRGRYETPRHGQGERSGAGTREGVRSFADGDNLLLKLSSEGHTSRSRVLS